LQRAFLRSLVPGFAAAIAVASIDSVTGFIATGSRFDSISYSAAAAGLVAAATLLVYLAVRWLLVAPIARRAPEQAASVATATGVGVFLITLEIPLPGSPVSTLFEMILRVGVAGAVGAGAIALDLAGSRAASYPVSRGVGRAAPLVLPPALVVAWIGLVGLGDVTSARFYLLFAALLIVAALFVHVAMSLSQRRWQAAVCAIFGAYLAAGAVGALMVAGGPQLSAPRAQTAPHKVRRVILLTVDTLRRDAVSAFGSTTVNTPGIDRLAGDGVVFHDAMAASSWTLPSFASMFTGLTARDHGVVRFNAVLADTVVTLAERFQDAGYETQALVANMILAPHRGFAQGFDNYQLTVDPFAPVCIGDYLASRLQDEPLRSETATGDLTDSAIAFMKSHRDEDFFLWVHYLDPHLRYSPPVEFVERMNVHDEMGFVLENTASKRPSVDLVGDPAHRVWVRSLYDAEARYVDTEIGRLLDWTRESGLYDETLIVFGVDHGEEFWEHDGFEHGHTLYNELLGVPLIIKTPGNAARGEVDNTVAVYDVAPTVLELCELPALDAPTAVSLVPYLAGGRADGRSRPIFASGTLWSSNFESVTFEGWKFIRSTTTGREQLFNLVDDPSELHNVVLDQPAVAARARALLDTHAQNAVAFRQSRGISNQSFQLDDEDIEMLRTLGYM